MRLELGTRHAQLGSKALSEAAALLACHVERAEPMLHYRGTSPTFFFLIFIVRKEVVDLRVDFVSDNEELRLRAVLGLDFPEPAPGLDLAFGTDTATVGWDVSLAFLEVCSRPGPQTRFEG